MIVIDHRNLPLASIGLDVLHDHPAPEVGVTTPGFHVTSREQKPRPVCWYNLQRMLNNVTLLQKNACLCVTVFRSREENARAAAFWTPEICVEVQSESEWACCHCPRRHQANMHHALLHDCITTQFYTFRIFVTGTSYLGQKSASSWIC